VQIEYIGSTQELPDGLGHAPTLSMKGRGKKASTTPPGSTQRGPSFEYYSKLCDRHDVASPTSPHITHIAKMSGSLRETNQVSPPASE